MRTHAIGDDQDMALLWPIFFAFGWYDRMCILVVRSAHSDISDGGELQTVSPFYGWRVHEILLCKQDPLVVTKRSVIHQRVLVDGDFTILLVNRELE